MTDTEIFNKLFNGGNFSLPYLIKLTYGNKKICLVNDNRSVTYQGDTYLISTFEYNPPDNSGSGASLSIMATEDNNLMEFVENADDTYSLQVVGLLSEDDTIQKLNVYKHFHGSVSAGSDNIFEFQLGSDDRLDLQFCPYTFDTDNNRANA